MMPDIKHDKIMRRPLHGFVAMMVWADEILNLTREIPQPAMLCESRAGLGSTSFSTAISRCEPLDSS
jgi:hypothetical protein